MDRRLFLVTTASTLAVAAFGTAAFAQGSGGAQALVRRVSDDMLALARGGGGEAAKRAGFMALMDRYANMRQIAGFALGRYQRTMPEALKPRYIEAFKRFVAAIYVDQFSQYTDATISIGNASPFRNGHVVDTVVQPAGGQPVAVRWEISDRNGTSMVEDFVIEGISMAASQRSEFTALIDSYGGDLERFVQYLESRG